MPPFLTTLIILSAAGLAVLFVLYRFYDKQVEEPRKLEDEIKEALEGHKETVRSVEPVRQAAVSLSIPGDRLIIVRQFGKVPTLRIPLFAVLGVELMVDGKVLARVIRGGAHKMIDDANPQGQDIRIRFIIDDAEFPSYELLMWHPTDGGTARSEGPAAAMDHARKWFYFIEALMLKQAKRVARTTEPKPSKTPSNFDSKNQNSDEQVEHLSTSETDDIAPKVHTKPNPSKSDGDVLNAPIVPYI